MKSEDLENLKKFLIEANIAGYAGGESRKWIKEKDCSTTIPFEKGKWKLDDNFFGGEPYGGRIIVFYDKKPFWMMVYYGFVTSGIDPNEVYAVLREALKNMPEKYPFRGPKNLEVGKFKYENIWEGGIKKYSGEEYIFQNKRVLYKANYMGGLVDIKKGV